MLPDLQFKRYPLWQNIYYSHCRHLHTIYCIYFASVPLNSKRLIGELSVLPGTKYKTEGCQSSHTALQHTSTGRKEPIPPTVPQGVVPPTVVQEVEHCAQSIPRGGDIMHCPEAMGVKENGNQHPFELSTCSNISMGQPAWTCLQQCRMPNTNLLLQDISSSSLGCRCNDHP